MHSGDCKLKVQINVFHDLSIKLRPQLTRGMGHRPEMVKISPACVGHNKNLSPLENILLLLFVEKVQRAARTSRLASKGFGEKKEIKV